MDDAGIIALFNARDERSLEETAAAYGPWCRAIAMNLLGVREDAEECVSDALHALWRRIPPESPVSLRVYLGRIVRNIAVSRRRERDAQKRGGGEVALALEELKECAGTASAEEELEAEELGRTIDRFLRTLPETECSLFLRRYWYLDSMETIARRFGLREGAVKTRLHRTREKLRVFLRKEGYAL